MPECTFVAQNMSLHYRQFGAESKPMVKDEQPNVTTVVRESLMVTVQLKETTWRSDLHKELFGTSRKSEADQEREMARASQSVERENTG